MSRNGSANCIVQTRQINSLFSWSLPSRWLNILSGHSVKENSKPCDLRFIKYYQLRRLRSFIWFLKGQTVWESKITRKNSGLGSPESRILISTLHSTNCITMGKIQPPLSFQFSSVAQSCPTLCDPMSYSTPGLPVHHQLLEFTLTHIHRVSDAIQLSHPLLSPSPPAPNSSQHQSLFQWVNSLHEVAKVLEFQL